MNGVRAALAAAVAQALDNDPRLAVVAGADDPLVGPVLATRRDRHVLAVGPAARLTVAEGLRRAGRPVCVFLDGDEPVGRLKVPVVVVSSSLEQAESAQAHGIGVLQPAWPTDAAPMLETAFSMVAPAFLRPHPLPADAEQAAVPPPVDATLRVLQRGAGGLVVGAGGAVPVLATAVRLAAQRGAELTAVDVHTLLAPGVVLIGSCDDHVWVTGRGAAADLDLTGTFRMVAVGGLAPRQVMDAILAAVPAG